MHVGATTASSAPHSPSPHPQNKLLGLVGKGCSYSDIPCSTHLSSLAMARAWNQVELSLGLPPLLPTSALDTQHIRWYMRIGDRFTGSWRGGHLGDWPAFLWDTSQRCHELPRLKEAVLGGAVIRNTVTFFFWLWNAFFSKFKRILVLMLDVCVSTCF